MCVRITASKGLGPIYCVSVSLYGFCVYIYVMYNNTILLILDNYNIYIIHSFMTIYIQEYSRIIHNNDNNNLYPCLHLFTALLVLKL